MKTFQIKLMTVAAIMAGLTPIFLTEGLGSDVMRRIALPMLGGMISTTLLTLIVIPAIYFIWVGRSLSGRRAAEDAAAHLGSVVGGNSV